jgi:hypothetical protein
MRSAPFPCHVEGGRRFDAEAARGHAIAASGALDFDVSLKSPGLIAHFVEPGARPFHLAWKSRIAAVSDARRPRPAPRFPLGGAVEAGVRSLDPRGEFGTDEEPAGHLARHAARRS